MDENMFLKHFSKLYRKLCSYETNKRMLPKFSFATKDLAEEYGIFKRLKKNITTINNSLSNGLHNTLYDN